MARRTLLVTGAASGIGATLMEVLRARGDRVIGVDLHQADIVADLSTEEGRTAMVAAAKIAAPEGLDGVAACAGIGSQAIGGISVNYFGAVATLAGLQPLLVRSDTPRAAAVASIAALDPVDEALIAACLRGDESGALTLADPVAYTVYSSAKQALVRWVQANAVTGEWAGKGVLLNMVAPGLIRTPMTAELMRDPAAMAQLSEAIPTPLGRWGEAQEIAELLAFLLSSENSYMVGQLIFVDGGAEATRAARR